MSKIQGPVDEITILPLGIPRDTVPGVAGWGKPIQGDAMTRKLLIVTMLALLPAVWLAACGSTAPPPNLEETVVAAVDATVAALPPGTGPG